jgi:6-phosphofructokinase 1
VIVAEGAKDRYSRKITSNQVKDILTERLHIDTRVTVLGHIQRGGRACAFDRYLSTIQGIEAVDAVLEHNPESPSPVITVRENKIERTSLTEAVRLTQRAAQAIKDKDFASALSLRDTEFKEYYSAYLNTTSIEHRKMKLPEEKVRAFLNLLVS